MKITALVEALVAAGATPEMILVAVRATEQQMADALEQRRQADADRQARKRERDKSRDITLRHSDRSLTGDQVTRVEDKSQTTEIEPLQENKPARRDVGEFRDALRAVLDDERLEALVKHRRSRKAPVTAHAARLFLRDVEACGISVAEAADHCISRNWLTVKPDWVAKLSPQARGSPNRPETPTDVASRLLAEMRSANGQPGTSDSRHQQALVAIPSGKRAGFG